MTCCCLLSLLVKKTAEDGRHGKVKVRGVGLHPLRPFGVRAKQYYASQKWIRITFFKMKRQEMNCTLYCTDNIKYVYIENKLLIVSFSHSSLIKLMCIHITVRVPYHRMRAISLSLPSQEIRTGLRQKGIVWDFIGKDTFFLNRDVS